MNKPNNKRKKESIERIEKVFLNLIQTKEINEITVTEICKEASINRSTFYANYLDVHDLADKIVEKFINNVYNLYEEERETKNNTNDYLKLFRHIKDNQIFYKTYFKLDRDKHFIIMEYDTNLAKKFYDDKYIDYHMEFLWEQKLSIWIC